VQGPTGIIAHLVRGFGEDGMWYEGENYHLFALRGQLVAMGWARQAGLDLLEDSRLAVRLEAALRAPAITALPDHTFPARKDSRFGVSLAQPMYLELWEVGLARLGDSHSDLWGWLVALYAEPGGPAERFDSYLHEAGEMAPPGGRRNRSDLSWWALLEMVPELPDATGAWAPGNALLEGQGLAILRQGDRYASLECGHLGGGHGHADRLHLTLHADGQHWLRDLGAGSYVTRDLFWYRSTLAHNAPRLDGVSQEPGDAVCRAFDEQGSWAWARGSFGPLSRTLVAGPSYLVDVVELSGSEEHLLELPWHLSGRVDVVTAGSWSSAAPLPDELVTDPERFAPGADGPIQLRAHAGSATLTLHLIFEGELLRAAGPGQPGSSSRETFYLARSRGRNQRLIALLTSTHGSTIIRSAAAAGDVIEVETTEGLERH
ncbi:MAG: heparinase II/III domain-containing protein, partial [Gemmatimonadales bacterium]